MLFGVTFILLWFFCHLSGMKLTYLALGIFFCLREHAITTTFSFFLFSLYVITKTKSDRSENHFLIK